METIRISHENVYMNVNSVVGIPCGLSSLTVNLN